MDIRKFFVDSETPEASKRKDNEIEDLTGDTPKSKGERDAEEGRTKEDVVARNDNVSTGVHNTPAACGSAGNDEIDLIAGQEEPQLHVSQEEGPFPPGGQTTSTGSVERKRTPVGQKVTPGSQKKSKINDNKSSGVYSMGETAIAAIAAVDAAVASLPAEEALQLSLMSEASFVQRAPDEPPMRGIKEPPPHGHPDALTGKTFVISGVMQSMKRGEVEEYIKKHGGRVTSAVSGKTSFLLVGDHTGKTKYHAAKQRGVTLIDEDGLRLLVGASVPFVVERNVMESTSPAMRVHELKNKDKTDVPIGRNAAAPTMKAPAAASKELWVEKWRPKVSTDLVGNNSQLSNLKLWLRSWDDVHLKGMLPPVPQGGRKDAASDMKKKAVLLSGSPGIGKTSAALIAAREEGFVPVEVNASDTRSKSDASVLKGIGGKLSNSIKEMSTNVSLAFGKKESHKLCLIMDEVDGMSAGDRGGVTDLIKTIGQSKVPIIAICNDKYSPKLKSLRNHCMELDFRKPTAIQIRKRMREICDAEGLQMNDATMDALIQSAYGGDIRLILGQLEMFGRKADRVSYEDVTQKQSKKDLEMSPFEAAKRLLDIDASDAYTFAEQVDLVFQDADLVPLLVQENYLNHRPKIARDEAQVMAVMAKAADEFSAGDLVSRSVRQYQNWALMPFANALGTVSPASYARGPRMTFGLYPGEANFPRFSAWLGQNSSHGKQKRLLGELHTNLLASGNFIASRTALRLSYIPVLKLLCCQPLVKEGKDGIPKVIDLMSEYSMKKDNFDSLFEIAKFKSRAPWAADIYKGIPTAVKSAFTRALNQLKSKDKLGTAMKTVKSKKKGAAAADDFEEDEFDDDNGSLPAEEEESEDELVQSEKLKQKLRAMKKRKGMELNLAEETKGKKKKTTSKKAK